MVRRMLEGVELVKLGVYARLESRFAREHGGDLAAFLSAAVVNELFSERPGNARAMEFSRLNRELITRELRALKRDEEIRRAVTDAVRVKAVLELARGGMSVPSWVEHLQRLEGLGILIPGGEVPSSEFALAAARFYESSVGAAER